MLKTSIAKKKLESNAQDVVKLIAKLKVNQRLLFRFCKIFEAMGLFQGYNLINFVVNNTFEKSLIDPH
jgi:hypothetical protein